MRKTGGRERGGWNVEGQRGVAARQNRPAAVAGLGSPPPTGWGARENVSLKSNGARNCINCLCRNRVCVYIYIHMLVYICM